MACQIESPRRTRVDKGVGWGCLVGARDGGCYADDHAIVANHGRMAAIDVGGIVAAIAVGSSGGGFGDVNVCVLA